ncbi:hypothetical protein [Micromonospora chokoriensis]|uniref:hypothetical protein n=1 Tax=Micromonospora chokoriensis TaxID=356851 RepID=UPI0018DD9A1B|nr:hypothetical protein [Micromonospora chokoriensis]
MDDKEDVELTPIDEKVNPHSFKLAIGVSTTSAIAGALGLVADAGQFASLTLDIALVCVGAVSAALCVVSLLRKGFNDSRRRVTFVVTILLISGAAIGVGTKQRFGSDPESLPASTAQVEPEQVRSPIAEGHFLEPHEPLPACALAKIYIEGGVPKTGWVYVVGHRDHETSRIYFVTVERASNGKWASRVPTGSNAAEVWLLAVAADWVNYLPELAPSAQSTRWSSENLPPGSTSLDHATFPLAAGC